jgi:hypothetical protein
MKIRPISDAEVAKMMSEGAVLYRKDRLPLNALGRFDNLCIVLKGFTLKEQIMFCAGLHFTNEDAKTRLPLLAATYDGDAHLQIVFRVNATDEADWYATYDAFERLLGMGTLDESFRDPGVMIALAGQTNILTGKIQELNYITKGKLTAHFGVAEVEQFAKEHDERRRANDGK